MTCFGADLSKRTIYLACVSTDKIHATASLDIVTNPLKGFIAIKNWFMACQMDRNIDKVIIEQPWANSRSPRPMSFLDLGRAAAFVEIAALQAGLEPVFVLPSEWRKVVYGKGRPDNAKELARETVKERFDWETRFKKDHNECEAILLGAYGNTTNE